MWLVANRPRHKATHTLKRRNDKDKKLRKIILREIPEIDKIDLKIFLNEIWRDFHQLKKLSNKLKYEEPSPKDRIDKETELRNGLAKIFSKIGSKLLDMPVTFEVIKKTKKKS